MATRRSPATLMAAAAGFKTLFTNGVFEFWTGAQPASAKDPMTGVKVGIATKDGAAFTPGQPAGGCTLADPVLVGDNAVLRKPDAELWQFKVLAAGTIQSCRYIANAPDNNQSSTTHHRLDMSVSTGSGNGEVKVSKLTYALGDAPGDIQSVEIEYGNPVLETV